MRLLFSCLFKTGSVATGKEGPVILSTAKELSSFSYFQRSSVGEMFTFFSRTFAANKNLAPGARTSVKQQGYLCHMYVSPFGVTAVCFADDEYPSRVAFGYLSRLCEVFSDGGGAGFRTVAMSVPSGKSSAKTGGVTSFDSRANLSIIWARTARQRKRGR